MVNDTSLPSQTKLNIDAAKKYVSTAEATIEDSAKIALQTLEKALSSSEETKEGLMALAQAVESAQTESAKEFTA
jgi:outer membrane protein TolC